MSDQRHGDRLWLEDIEVGSTFHTLDHLIEEAEIVEFSDRFDPQPFHLSDSGATGTLFETLSASGWHTAAITMRLLVTSGIPIATGIIGASVAVSWPTPTRPGDRLHVELTVTEVRRSRSKPDRGFVMCEYDTINQHGETRQHTTANLVAFAQPGPTS